MGTSEPWWYVTLPWNCQHQPATGGPKRKRHQNFRGLRWHGDLHHKPDINEYFTGVTLPDTTDNLKPDGNSYITDEIWLYVPTMRIMPMASHFILRGLKIIKLQFPSEVNMSEHHKQTESYTTIKVPMSSGPLVEHYMSVLDSGWASYQDLYE